MQKGLWGRTTLSTDHTPHVFGIRGSRIQRDAHWKWNQELHTPGEIVNNLSCSTQRGEM